MLRPHSLESLSPKSFSAVTKNGDQISMPGQPEQFHNLLRRLCRENQILGGYITFQSKTMRIARAYLPILSTVSRASEFALICPVLALLDISRRGLLKRKFLHALNKKKKLTHYLQYITGLDNYIAPYALRIGGRTWLLAEGLDRQFVDYLGTWKSPEASARYYRASPRSVLLSLQRFYINASKWRYICR